MRNKNQTVPAFREIVEYFTDGIADEGFELLETLRDALRELKENPLACVTCVKDAVENERETLREKGVCPVCGGRLETVSAPEEETLVPYGEGYTGLGDGFRTECARCGYNSED